MSAVKAVRRGNQHKPNPPDEELRPLVEYYWSLGLNGKDIVSQVCDEIDLEQYGFSYASFRRRKDEWGLQGVRRQGHTIETIQAAVKEVRIRFPTMGARAMVAHLRTHYNDMRVPEKVLLKYFRMVEPQAVLERKFRRFKRRLFWVAGVNDLWCFDQHDKLRRFGLFLHAGYEPGAGRIVWMKIWWTNRNPRLVTSYYLEAARKIQGIPLLTQSDPGTENVGIANCHTNIRHELDPSLAETRQHRWMRMKANIKPEIVWSILRRMWSPGFENCLQEGLGVYYDPEDPMERLLFLWLAVPWLQAELDSWVAQFNSTQRRKDKHKILPQGIPDLVTRKPERYQMLDFKVTVQPELFDRMEAAWAPPDHAVFQLVPPEFGNIMANLYQNLGSPVVQRETFWPVYNAMHDAMAQAVAAEQFQEDIRTRERVEEEEVEPLPGLREMRLGGQGPHGLYAGGAAAPAVPASFEKWYKANHAPEDVHDDGTDGEEDGDEDEGDESDDEYRASEDPGFTERPEHTGRKRASTASAVSTISTQCWVAMLY